MKDNAVKIVVVFLLGFVVVGTAVACIFFESPNLNADTPYNYLPLPRRASLSLEPSVEGVNLLDGEQGSTPRWVMYHAPYYYIFGETLSCERDFERDFEGSAVFVALVGSAGTVFNVVTFAGERFVSAKNTGVGFVVLTNSHLVGVSFEGSVTSSVEIENGVDMYFNRGQGIAVVFGKEELSISIYSSELAHLKTTKVAREVALEYVGMLAAGTKYMLFLNTPSFPTICSVQTEVSFDDISSLNGCRMTDFVPADGGGFILALIDKNQGNLARAVRYKNLAENVYTGGSDCSSFKIFDTENAYFFRTFLGGNLSGNDEGKYNVAEVDRNMHLVYGSRTALGGSNVLVGVFSQVERYALLDNGSSTFLRRLDAPEQDVFTTQGTQPLYSLESSLLFVTLSSSTTSIIIPSLTFLNS